MAAKAVPKAARPILVTRACRPLTQHLAPKFAAAISSTTAAQTTTHHPPRLLHSNTGFPDSLSPWPVSDFTCSRVLSPQIVEDPSVSLPLWRSAKAINLHLVYPAFIIYRSICVFYYILLSLHCFSTAVNLPQLLWRPIDPSLCLPHFLRPVITSIISPSDLHSSRAFKRIESRFGGFESRNLWDHSATCFAPPTRLLIELPG